MKKLFALVLALVMVLSMASLAVAEEPVTLRIVWWGSQTRHDGTLAVIDRYMELNPHVTIEAEYMAWSNYWDKLASQAAAGTMPDIFQHDYNYIETYARSGLSLPLDEYVGKELDLSDIAETYTAAGYIDGKLHGLTIGAGGPTVIYDPAVFAELGMEEPNPTWTYADFEAAMRKIREEKKIYGATMLYDGEMYRGFEAYARQKGEMIFNAEGQLGFDRQTLVDYMTMYTGWQADRLVCTPDVLVDAKVNIEADPLITGKSAMLWRNSNQIVGIAKAAGRELKMTAVPMMEDQVQFGGYIKPVMYWAVSKDSQNPAEAVKFISYFLNDIEANKILNAERGVPVAGKVREALYDSLGAAEKTMFDYVSAYVDFASPMDPPQPAAFGEVQALMGRAEEQVVYGEKTVEEAVDEFLEQANKAIANAS